MKKTQAKKKSEQKKRYGYEVIELPSENGAMEKFVEVNRAKINEKIVDNIEYAMRRRLAGIEIFSFTNSNFVVVLNRKDFKDSLVDIYEFSLNNEHFETCEKVKKMMDRLDKLSYIFTYTKTK